VEGEMDILLKGAVYMLFAALVLAWVGTFTKLIVIRPVQAMIKDYEALIRAHIDLLLMSPFCLALYAVRIRRASHSYDISLLDLIDNSVGPTGGRKRLKFCPDPYNLFIAVIEWRDGPLNRR
jgi:hypothetical protein